jgi:hypothetical protein
MSTQFILSVLAMSALIGILFAATFAPKADSEKIPTEYK